MKRDAITSEKSYIMYVSRQLLVPKIVKPWPQTLSPKPKPLRPNPNQVFNMFYKCWVHQQCQYQAQKTFEIWHSPDQLTWPDHLIIIWPCPDPNLWPHIFMGQTRIWYLTPKTDTKDMIWPSINLQCTTLRRRLIGWTWSHDQKEQILLARMERELGSGWLG